ncbi:type II secretion system protein F [Sinomonas cellulolyticus]|uniref:Type II secretion system F family protein n=1 Tax=Sinomonas cellulolyticus TaxID=2801916 RepID=A0ABS1K6T3_9MICC|nr:MULTISPECIES: type II secretion system F family protein [Sinomonas]MBL0706587.1 type II secretion system F family protein [Sinomonas cellulolyticus]GHG45430.1 type II secretion system protein F [Sinomonas sp. KCTC 49339]
MAAAVGLLGGAGLFLVWWSFWPLPERLQTERRPGRLAQLIVQAGIQRVTPGGLVLSSLGLGAFVALAFYAVTAAAPVGLCFGLFAAGLPVALVSWQAKRRAAVMRELWPDVVDHIRSAIRAGLSLPEALMQLGYKGPEQLRGTFLEFAADYRSGGSFSVALDRLKERLSDPVADRIVEALRLTTEVGGSDLGRLLGTLSEFLRESARTRSELEARQSWTVNAARLAVAAPWIVLLLMSTRPEAMAAYARPAGLVVLIAGLAVSAFCYRLMLRIGALPQEERVLR